MNDFQYECRFAAEFASVWYPSFAEYERYQHLYRFKSQAQLDKLHQIWETNTSKSVAPARNFRTAFFTTPLR